MTQPTRSMRLFEAHRSIVRWNWKDGAKWFKQRVTLIKRLQTQFGQIGKDCGAVLEPSEKKTLEEALALLHRLSGDFEVAEQHARKYGRQLQDEYAQQEELRYQKLTLDVLGTPSDEELRQYIDDIRTLVNVSRSPQEIVSIFGARAENCWGLRLTLDLAPLADSVAKEQPLPVTSAQAMRSIILWLEQFVDITPERYSSTQIDRKMWDAWRAHRQRLRSLLVTHAFQPGLDADDQGY